MSEDSQFVLGLSGLILTIFISISGLITVSHWAKAHFNPPSAVYELETGEYLHCTPQGGNELRCEVTHR